MRQIENIKTQADKPVKDVVIANCGQLSADEAATADARAPDAYGDEYEDFPEDQPGGPLSAATILKIATDCKDYGNKAFKSGDHAVALDKYQKGLRYLNEDPEETPETKDQLAALRISLNGNSALMNLKLEAWDECVRSADNALAVASISSKDKAKALYRKGFALARLKDEEGALKSLEEAKALAPEDAAVVTELARIKKAHAERVAKEKAAYKKFFQ